jgi:hypothetical protein
MIADQIEPCPYCGSFTCDRFCVLRSARSGERDNPEFACKVCGVQCDVAPADGSGAICPEHCEDHEYEHDSMRGGKFCKHCDAPIPDDFYDC